jgi:hypothetical protein
MIAVGIVKLTDLEWEVLLALKRELAPDEIKTGLWATAHGKPASTWILSVASRETSIRAKSSVASAPSSNT